MLTKRLTPGLGSYVGVIVLGLFLPVSAVLGYLVIAVYINRSFWRAAAPEGYGGFSSVLHSPVSQGSSWARLLDSSRFASACSRSSLALFFKVVTASAPAGKRSGGSSWAARWTSASASLAGSPPC